MSHCELNPKELIWAQVKGRVARLNQTFRLKDVKQLVHESLANIQPENWRKATEHVERVEQASWVADALQEETLESLIMHVNPDGNESTCSDNSSSESSTATECESD